MKKILFLPLALFACAFAATDTPSTDIAMNDAAKIGVAKNDATKIGVVNFRRCVEESKQGRAEQAAFESLKNQMSSVLEKTEKELQDLSKKLEDPDYLDGLSPDAEQELKAKYNTLHQDMARYQNQYYQILNQANVRVMQAMSTQVGEAATTIAKQNQYSFVVNEDACFFYLPTTDITALVVAEMDKHYNGEQTTIQPKKN